MKYTYIFNAKDISLFSSLSLVNKENPYINTNCKCKMQGQKGKCKKTYNSTITEKILGKVFTQNITLD